MTKLAIILMMTWISQWWQWLSVATHNHNRSEPQSSQFWDQINCNYPVS